MSKTKSLALQCIGTFCAFTFIFWWVGWREYQKAYPVKVKQGTTQINVPWLLQDVRGTRTVQWATQLSKIPCPQCKKIGGMYEGQASGNNPGDVKCVWCKTYYSYRSIVNPKLVKVYQGKWHKEGFLEVIGK